MSKTLSAIATVLALAAGVSAQEKPAVTTADFAGTWNIEVMSHQIALVIEAQDSKTVTATMMAMGRDTPLKGELVDRTLTLVGVKTDADAASAAPADDAAAAHAAAEPGAGHEAHAAPAPKPIVATLQEDGTLSGEMMTSAGPVKWTAEKLRKRKG
jgi:hypothetical protein